MEERAKQRKEKRELLKQRYEEKRQAELEAKRAEEAKKEEERLQKIQEEKDAKREAKLAEKRRKEELQKQAEDLSFKMQAAAEYYDQ